MIEAKENYADFVARDSGRRILTNEWVKQAPSQIEASRGRRIEWYFHDPAAAAAAQKAFSADEEIGGKITVHVLPYPGGVPKPNPRIK